MVEDTKVQFVCFATILDTEKFMKRWKEFNRSSLSDVDVTLQQCKKDGQFHYIAQHRLDPDGVQQFEFVKEGRAGKIVRERIKTTLAGGYSLLEPKFPQGTKTGEIKIFIFLADAKTDLTLYKTVPVTNKLNIYQAYYENCRYAYILEYFVKDKGAAAELSEYLIGINGADPTIYTAYAHIKDRQQPTRADHYTWPSF